MGAAATNASGGHLEGERIGDPVDDVEHEGDPHRVLDLVLANPDFPERARITGSKVPRVKCELLEESERRLDAGFEGRSSPVFKRRSDLLPSQYRRRDRAVRVRVRWCPRRREAEACRRGWLRRSTISDLTIAEVAWEFHRRTGRSVSPAAMGRTLQKLGFTRKESLTATEQAEPRIQELRGKFIAYAKTLDTARLVFLDEAGSHIAMTRDYGRAPRCERVHGSVPRNRGEVTSMIGALGVRGMRALMTVESGTDAAVFEAFVEKVLVRKLRPGDIVVLDNVGAHKPDWIRQLVTAAGARLLFLPPYSPDLNPIELGWAKQKGALTINSREARARAGRRAPSSRRASSSALRCSP